MILRSAALAHPTSAHPTSEDAEPAWPVFQNTQGGVGLPRSLVSQPHHAELAGALASRLTPEAFGPLPDDILEAIRLHDMGWEEPDREQICSLQEDAAVRPASFLAISPAVSTLAWRRSIRHAETISPAASVIVSRHFCSLATDGEEHHRKFLEEETERRRAAEESFGQEADLTRWLGALGFCDLLSLTMCSGHGTACADSTCPSEHAGSESRRKGAGVLL